MSVADSETVNEVTPFVGGTSAGAGDPSVHTAVGIVHGLRAVLKWQFERDDFAGMKVAGQGLVADGWGVDERLPAECPSLLGSYFRMTQMELAAERLGARLAPGHKLQERK